MGLVTKKYRNSVIAHRRDANIMYYLTKMKGITPAAKLIALELMK